MDRSASPVAPATPARAVDTPAADAGDPAATPARAAGASGRATPSTPLRSQTLFGFVTPRPFAVGVCNTRLFAGEAASAVAVCSLSISLTKILMGCAAANPPGLGVNCGT